MSESVKLQVQLIIFLADHIGFFECDRGQPGFKVLHLTERVIAGKRAGQSVADLQRTITAASLKSLRSGDFVPADAPEAVGTGIKESIDNMYERVEKTAYTGTEPVRLRE